MRNVTRKSRCGSHVAVAYSKSSPAFIYCALTRTPVVVVFHPANIVHSAGYVVDHVHLSLVDRALTKSAWYLPSVLTVIRVEQSKWRWDLSGAVQAEITVHRSPQLKPAATVRLIWPGPISVCGPITFVFFSGLTTS